jgi:signal transduction histidine kinase
VPSAVVDRREPAETTWTTVEQAEYADRDAAGAAREYRALARSDDPGTRAGALVRLARTQKGLGRADEALQTYGLVTQLTGATVNGDPADLLGRWARVELLRTLKRDAAGEGTALAADLSTGKWAIDRTTYQVYAAALEPWIPESDAATAQLTEACVATWTGWLQRSSAVSETPRGWQSITAEGGPVLVVWRHEQASLYVLAATPRYMERAWAPWLNRPDQAVTLVDRGLAVIGHQPRGEGPVVHTRSPSETGLPWTIQVAAVSTPAAIAEAGRTRRWLIVAGLTMLAILLPASGYLVSRAVQRELIVARQQADFVSAVSHEFRSPLTSLTHLTSLLRGGPQPSEARRREYYDVLAHEADRLQRFVDALLDFGRMRAGAARYRFKPVDLPALIERSVDEFRHDALAHGRTISSAIASDVPAISADPDALGRVVWNLLDNAAKYSPPGSPIEVETEAAPGGAALRVIDHGIGIPEGEQSHVFEQFYRGSAATTSAVRGTGIGLAVVSHIVRAHGGTVAVDSAVGRGTTFTVTLPAADGRT